MAAWDDSSLLEQVKQSNLDLERRDGVRRHFEYDWQEVAKYNESYRAYVEAERERLGESHPLFLTQYCLKPLHAGGGFLSDQQRAQMRGDYPRLHHPSESRVTGVGGREVSTPDSRLSTPIFVAGVDIAGEDEEAEDAALRSLKPRKDSTVVTIAAVEPAGGQMPGDNDQFPQPSTLHPQPSVRIVEHYYRTGVKHAALHAQLVDWLRNVWRCKKVVVDATGVGQATASYLADALGSVVTPYVFTAPSKSLLAYAFLAAVNAGRLKMYVSDQSEEARQFWFQMARAKSAIRANQTMNFYVDPVEGHDDFLVSTALAVHAADLYRPREARGKR